MTPSVSSGSPLPDLSGVLAPLPGPSPAGPSLRYDPVYDAIREARRSDDPALPQGVWQTDHKRADWSEVVRLCLDVLEHQSKDLQVACWLVEALVHRHGFVAFAPSLRMIGGLCHTFWTLGLNPPNENGDFNARFAPLEWLDGKLTHLLCTLPVTRSTKQPEVSFSYSDYLNAQRLGVAGARDPAILEQARKTGKSLPDDVEANAAATLSGVLRAYYHDLSRAIEETKVLAGTLAQLSAGAAPGMVGLRNRLADIQGWIYTTLCAKGEPPGAESPPPPPPRAGDDSQPAGLDTKGPVPSGPISSREEAYYWVAAAAEYLLRNEPHSPTPYLLQRAIQWGDMPLHQILMDISRGSNDLALVIDFLGFNFKEKSKNVSH